MNVEKEGLGNKVIRYEKMSGIANLLATGVVGWKWRGRGPIEFVGLDYVVWE